MSLERIMLIVVVVGASIGFVLYMVGLLIAGFTLGWAGLLILVLLVPLVVVAYVAGRVIRERINSREDDHYDSIEK